MTAKEGKIIYLMKNSSSCSFFFFFLCLASDQLLLLFLAMRAFTWHFGEHLNVCVHTQLFGVHHSLLLPFFYCAWISRA